VLIDTHCHVDQFPSPETVVRECESNRMRVIAVTNLPSHYAMAADRLRKHPFVTAALGLHPLSASRGLRELSTFKRLAHVADFIGEIGLDFSRHGKDTRGIQERVFEEILQAIKDRPRFITLHSRGAEKAVLEGLIRNGIHGAIFHWFTGSAQDLAAVVEAGHHVSINLAMLGSESGRLVIDSTPKNMILVESDAPLAKVNGRVSSPNDVALVYEELAKKWQLSLGETIETIRGTFTRITDQFEISHVSPVAP
jgi:TatD DNase family protein